jgi:fatty acid elongase 3
MDAVTSLATDLVKAIDVQVPSISRPFGVHLWPIFDVFYQRAAGQSATDFRFVYGETPLGTLRSAGSMIVAYYAIIFGGRALMTNFPAFKLQRLFQIHNLLLTIISGGLLALFMEELIPTVYNHGIFYGICSHEGGWTKPLVTLYYVSCLMPRLGEQRS